MTVGCCPTCVGADGALPFLGLNQPCFLSRTKELSIETWCRSVTWRWRCWETLDEVELVCQCWCLDFAGPGSLSNVCTVTSLLIPPTMLNLADYSPDLLPL